MITIGPHGETTMPPPNRIGRVMRRVRVATALMTMPAQIIVESSAGRPARMIGFSAERRVMKGQ
jgi:hypothetical protein